jgi:hypothetical protein
MWRQREHEIDRWREVDVDRWREKETESEKINTNYILVAGLVEMKTS